jgi:hypothetical protein
LTKVIGLKRYGRQRLVSVHEQDDLRDVPRWLLTDAWHWERGRGIDTWSDRWASAILHAFSKPVTGLAAAQGRKEEAVQRHCRWRGVAQSLGQRAPAAGAETARLAFAKGEPPLGQRCRALTREVLHGLRQFITQKFAQGHASAGSLEMFMPA